MGHKTKTKAMSLGKQLVSMGLIDRDEEEMRRWEGREDFKYVMIDLHLWKEPSVKLLTWLI